MKSHPLIPFGAIMGLGIALMLIISFYGASQVGPEAKETAEANPKAIYEQNCASCHGANLQGAVGPSLKKIGSKMTKEEILKQIKTGTPGKMPGGIIKGEQAKMVAEWLSKKK